MGRHFPLSIPLLAVSVALAGLAVGQTPEEHASHHPAPGGTPPAPPTGTPMPAAGAPPAAAGTGMAGAPPTAPGGMPMPATGDPAAAAGGGMPGMPPAAGGGMGAGMGAGMGEMMKQMGVPPRKEIYPSLMAMPPLTPEKRAGVEQLAHARMKAGAALMSSALEKMGAATSYEDYLKMQEASAQVRQGILQFESGLAAHRALSEGEAPRNVALEWFKRDMNLLPFADIETSHGWFGLSWFHYFTMALLTAFAFAMLAMYFFKMRRATALFGRLEPDAGSPPPGSSPPIGGAAGPSAPPGGKAPPASGSPPAPAQPKVDAPEPSDAGKAPTPPQAGEPPPPAMPARSSGAHPAPSSTASPADQEAS